MYSKTSEIVSSYQILRSLKAKTLESQVGMSESLFTPSLCLCDVTNERAWFICHRFVSCTFDFSTEALVIKPFLNGDFICMRSLSDFLFDCVYCVRCGGWR